MAIRSFAHKGLRAFYCDGDLGAIGSEFHGKAKLILSALAAATCVDDVKGAHGFHPLKGNRKGTYSMKVSANWRMTFKFSQGHVVNVNFEDYHN
jgi:proteic killer suppression protein